MNKGRYTKRALFLVSILILTCLASMPTWASRKIGKTIVFADSYGTHPHNGTKWMEYVEKEFRLNKNTMIEKVRAGSGFAVEKNTKNFLYKLKKMKADPNVRTILIVGAVTNDMKFPEATVRKKMKEFNKLALKKFPKATIYYGIPHWTAKGKADEERVLKRKIFFNKEAKALKWKQMANTEGCLYRQGNWYEKDLVHPNATGAWAIGKAIIKDLKSFKIKRN